MKKHMVFYFLFLCIVPMLIGGRSMDEGMWLLDSINKLPLAEMKKHGLELTPEQIFSQTGPSLKDAIVWLGGGTASFVSPEGLMMTNHHVAFGGIQALSSVQDDYLKTGFWAKTKGEELSTSYTGQLMIDMKDISQEVLASINDTMSAEVRAKAIQAKSQEIEKNSKGTTDYVCRVSEMFNGGKYYLFTYQQLNDIRLVYAPPSAIGNYGGEVDNWIWPRHTGDFSLMRAYVAPDGKSAKYSKDNVPFKPKMFLPISTKGYTEGSFAMIMGFPGRTFRYREAAGVQIARDETLPTTIDLYKTRMDIIEKAGKKDRALEIKYASRIRGMANTYKNYLGTLEGMRRADLLTLKRKEEAAFASYIKSDPDLVKRYGTLLSDFEKATDELKTYNRKNILLTNLTSGVDVLRISNRFRVYAAFPKDSLGNTIPPSAKEQGTMREFLKNTFKNFDLSLDKQTLQALILKSADMPGDQQLAALRGIWGNTTGAERTQRIQEFVDQLYNETSLAAQDACEKLLTGDADKILSDEYVKFASQLEAEQAPVQAKSTKINTLLGQLRAKYVEAWLRWKKTETVYPDANRTLRLTYGVVKPFHPRDAVEYNYFTTLTGVMEKEQNEDPFIVPAKLRELWLKKDFGRYADPKIGDVPVAFIANLDITGGNSGSPVINGKGELIGCAFDGNWEAVVGDYYFQEPLNRTISVDSRYVLFVLDKYSGAENILKEIVIH